MGRRADAHERLAGGKMRTHGVELLTRGSAAANADDQQVGRAQRGHEAGKVVLIRRVRSDDRHAIAPRPEVSFGKLRECFPRVIFVFPDHQHDVRRLCSHRDVHADAHQNRDEDDEAFRHQLTNSLTHQFT